MSRRLPRAAVFLALASGCGLSVVGSLERDGDHAGADGGVEASVIGRDGDPGDTGIPIGDDAADAPEPILDGGLDANPANCLAKCDGGTCDGGFCTFDCPTGQCQNQPVVCPPGIPCAVQCTGNSSCNKGVDCSGATACDIDCSGPSSCTNGVVRCSGAFCNVKCAGNTACNQGVQCDAGTCGITCIGPSSCTNGAGVQCNSNDCKIQCGDGSGAGNSACNAGVSCFAAQSCDIACTDPSTCTNKRVIAIAGLRANVECSGNSACNQGVFASAPDSGVFCKDISCGPGIFCDGGTCTGHCDTTDVDFCCKATTCKKAQQSGCTLNNSCP